MTCVHIRLAVLMARFGDVVEFARIIEGADKYGSCVCPAGFSPLGMVPY